MNSHPHNRLLFDLRNKLPGEIIVDVELRGGRWYAIIDYSDCRRIISITGLIDRWYRYTER